MEKEILNINKLEAKDGVITIVHRTDKTPQVHEQVAVEIDGVISAPHDFISQRKEQLADLVKESFILYDFDAKEIMLTINESVPSLQKTIKGTLTENPVIGRLKINTTAEAKNQMNSKQISDLLKFSKAFFATPENCLPLIETLQNTKYKITQSVEKNLNTGSGNEKNLYERAIEGVEPMHFDVLIPVYVGQEAKKFRVNINIDARDKEVVFYLESPELAELLQTEVERIIKTELTKFKGLGYVIIQQ